MKSQDGDVADFKSALGLGTPMELPRELLPECGFWVSISLLTVEVDIRLPTPALQHQEGLDDEKVVCPVTLHCGVKTAPVSTLEHSGILFHCPCFRLAWLCHALW